MGSEPHRLLAHAPQRYATRRSPTPSPQSGHLSTKIVGDRKDSSPTPEDGIDTEGRTVGGGKQIDTARCGLHVESSNRWYISWYIFAMKRYPMPDQVVAALGDKIINGFNAAVELTREDLATYRTALPEFVADHSNRGLANWIHDRMWARTRSELDDIDNISWIDEGPKRDIFKGLDFHIRLKRHSPGGAIRSYPTQSALDFITQSPDLFTGIGVTTVKLCLGYEWDGVERRIGSPVMSLRDGSFDTSIWMVDLPRRGSGGGTVTPIMPSGDGPPAPVIELPRIGIENNEGDITP